MFFSVMVALATAAPLLSVRRPSSEPVASCACTKAGSDSAASIARLKNCDSARYERRDLRLFWGRAAFMVWPRGRDGCIAGNDADLPWLLRDLLSTTVDATVPGNVRAVFSKWLEACLNRSEEVPQPHLRSLVSAHS